MKKGIALSLSAMVAVSAFAADSVETMFSEGKVSGEIREFYISREVISNGSTAYTRNANAIGGHLKYETASLSGLSLGTAFYTTNAVFTGAGNNTDYTDADPTLLGKDNKSYSIMGEAYVKYDMKDLGTKTDIKIGRQRLDTPLAGSDDARMLPNLFEAYVLHNKDVENTTLVAAHVTKFAQGTFGRAYNGGNLAATAGYSYTDSRNQVGDFVDMGQYAFGVDTDGVSVVAAIYAKDGLKIQAWDYYAYDLMNAIYLQADMKYDAGSMKPFVAAQYLQQDAAGDKLAGEVDSNYWGLKAGASIDALTAYIAYSQQSDSDATTDAGRLLNSTITPWGGMPAFTQGMVTRHQFIAGTDAFKLAASYNFKDMGLKAVAYYAEYDMDNNSGYGTARTTKEPGFDFIYKPAAVKNLQLRLRGNFPTDYANNVDWNEYRFIATYKF